MKPRLAITMGDPAGVGPELCVMACADARVLEMCDLVVVGSEVALGQAAALLGLPMPETIEEIGHLTPHFLKKEISAECGLVAYQALMRGIELARSGAVAGLVTAPLNKAAMNRAGIPEVGHTEILAKATLSPNFALMLYSERIVCSFVTCHQSLASVPGSLSSQRVVDVAQLTHEALLRIRGKAPRLGLLGLNPHAGEEGLFGREEIEILAPAVDEARRSGIFLSDPLPPDTAFMPGALEKFDGFVCLYHDQGGIPFKMLAFEEGVNITLGLPILRTSVDHGTAFDIAWNGKASAASLLSAIELAVRLGPPTRTTP